MNNSNFNLRLKTFHPYYFKQFINLLEKEKNNLDIINIKDISLPTKKKRFTVLRSPHVNKKSREQFEFSFYNKLLNIELQPNTKLKRKLFQFIKSNSVGLHIQFKTFY